MFLLTLRDLQYRAVRFMIAIVGTALVFSMALIMSGLFEGFHQEPRIPIGAVGADAWVIKEGATGAFTSIAQIQSKVADDLAAAGAERADPVLIARTSVTTPTGDRDVVLFGYRLGGLGEPGPRDRRRREGRARRGPGDGHPGQALQGRRAHQAPDDLRRHPARVRRHRRGPGDRVPEPARRHGDRRQGRRL